MLTLFLNGMILGFVSSPSCSSNAEGIRLGTRYHAGYALLVAGGAVIGDAAVLAALLLGLLPLLDTFSSLNTVLYFLGGVVLLYVSWGIFREALGKADSWRLAQLDATRATGVRVRRWILVVSGLIVLGYALSFLWQTVGMVLGRS
jgi:threonine/homoserine/homoserine lactone efflux protein